MASFNGVYMTQTAFPTVVGVPVTNTNSVTPPSSINTGGLCAFGTLGVTLPTGHGSAGPLVAGTGTGSTPGLIPIVGDSGGAEAGTVSTSGLTLLSFIDLVQPVNPTGVIWWLKIDGTDIGHSKIVTGYTGVNNPLQYGQGQFTNILTANGTRQLSITNLSDQWFYQTWTSTKGLPVFFGQPGLSTGIYPELATVQPPGDGHVFFTLQYTQGYAGPVFSGPVVNLGATALGLTWVPNPSIGLPADTYSVRYGTSPTGPWTQIDGITTLGTAVTGLAPGTTYYFQALGVYTTPVAPLGTTGLSGWSPQISGTTAAQPPINIQPLYPMQLPCVPCCMSPLLVPF